MSEVITLLAMFKDIEPASEGVEKLQQLGLSDDDMNVISGIPVKNTILGGPAAITYVSRIGLFGAIMGMALGIFRCLWVGSPSSLCRRVSSLPLK